jgi:hypothetical protein
MLSPNSDYASSASDANGQASNTGTATENSTQGVTANGNGTNTVDGYQGVPADLIMRYREAIINVDLMIINELEECFMGIWDTGDVYSDNDGILYS